MSIFNEEQDVAVRAQPPITNIPVLTPESTGAIIERGSSHRVFCNIGEVIDSTTLYIQLIKWLNDATEEDSIVINIYSPGGMVDIGINIIHAMANTKAKTTTIAFGVAASIAAVIWACGQDRRIADTGVVMFHMPSAGIAGKTSDVAEECTHIQKYFTDLLTHITRGLLTPEEIDTLVTRRADLYLTSATLDDRLRTLAGNEPPKEDNNATI